MEYKYDLELKDYIEVNEDFTKRKILTNNLDKCKIHLFKEIIDPSILSTNYLSDLLKMDQELINKIINYDITLLINDSSYSFEELIVIKDNALYGVEALKYLFEVNKIDLSLLNKIIIKDLYVPKELILRIEKIEKEERIDDLCYFLSNKWNRLSRLEKMDNVPKLILVNERRLYQRHVNEYYEYLIKNL